MFFRIFSIEVYTVLDGDPETGRILYQRISEVDHAVWLNPVYIIISTRKVQHHENRTHTRTESNAE